ncbi:helix-turn-helix transcriptional regulator [Listeria aquatica]|uniref:helix-turn-helix domain-containing protein n=1 Tax=Listeria aquatica TaxID=1494960 RepID=UPI0031F525E1
MIGETLKKLRFKKSKTQQNVADYLGISRAAYSHFENSRNEPDLETLKKLAEYFEVTTDYLLGNDESNKSDVVAAHMDDGLTEEQKEEIYRYIEAIKIRDKNNEK